MTSKVLLERLNGMGEYVKSASSTIEPPVVRRYREKFPDDAPKAAAPAGCEEGPRQEGRPGGRGSGHPCRRPRLPAPRRRLSGGTGGPACPGRPRARRVPARRPPPPRPLRLGCAAPAAPAAAARRRPRRPAPAPAGARLRRLPRPAAPAPQAPAPAAAREGGSGQGAARPAPRPGGTPRPGNNPFAPSQGMGRSREATPRPGNNPFAAEPGDAASAEPSRLRVPVRPARCRCRCGRSAPRWRPSEPGHDARPQRGRPSR